MRVGDSMGLFREFDLCMGSGGVCGGGSLRFPHDGRVSCSNMRAQAGFRKEGKRGIAG